MKNTLNLVVIFVFLGGLGYFLLSQEQISHKFDLISTHQYGVFALITLLYILVQGGLLKCATQPFGVKLRFFEWFGLILVTLFGNYFLPAAGLGIRAVYLKTIHNLNLTSFTVSVTAIYLIELLVFGVGGILGLWLAADLTRSDSMLFFTAFLVGVIVLSMLLVFNFRFKWEDKKLFKIANTVLDDWRKFKSNTRILLMMTLLTIVEFVLYALMFFYAFNMLQEPISAIESFIFSAISDYSFFIKFTPAGVGTYEASILYASSLIDQAFNISMAGTALIRIVTIAVLVIVTPLFALPLYRIVKNSDKFQGFKLRSSS